MPPLNFCGHSFLVAADDLVFIVPWFVLLHATWALLDNARVFVQGLQVMRLSPWLLHGDSLLCMATIPVDFGIGLASTNGLIMRPRRWAGLLQCLLLCRIVLTVPLLVNYAYILVPTLGHAWRILTSQGVHVPPGAVADVGGWGPTVHPHMAVLLVLLLIILRAIVSISSGAMVAMLLIPESMKGFVVSKGIRTAILLIGIRDGLLTNITLIFMSKLLGEAALNLLSPTDWVFGLMLLAFKQRQGLLGFDPDAEEVPVPRRADESTRLLDHDALEQQAQHVIHSSVLRATHLTGVHRDVTPFDPLNADDQAVLREILHLAPFASGIYGQALGVGFMRSAAEPGTHIPTPARLLQAIWRFLPCTQRHRPVSERAQRCSSCCCCCCFGCPCCGRDGLIEGDYVCGFHEDALYHAVTDEAARHGAPVPELLWASWKYMGPETSPPLAVILDHQRRQMVITVRGTADGKDVLADLGAHPLFYDPLGLAGPDAQREEPFNDDTDFFVHGTVLACARDAWSRLQEKHVLEDVLRPQCRAHGYRIVCVGHSLGAGIACLLAFQLRATVPSAQEVQYLGYECPGGLLSKRLARETQRLGWLSVACAHDWVPRMSVKNLQKVKNQVLDELASCDRSKLQLLALLAGGFCRQLFPLCCLRRPLASFFEGLAGGPLGTSTRQHNSNDLKILEACRSCPSDFFRELLPAGNIVYFRPVAHKFRCGWFLEHDIEWTAEWADAEDLHEIIFSVRALELHAPWIYEHGIGCAARYFAEVAAARATPAAQLAGLGDGAAAAERAEWPACRRPALHTEGESASNQSV